MPQDNNATSNECGRPTKYRKVYDKQVYKLCLLGATDQEIADFFDVSEATINNWKLEHKGFLESIKKGKVIADAEVSDSLNKRAKGYSFKEVTKELKTVTEDGEKKQKLVVTKEITKDIPPDTGAAMAWLKNRRPKDWRDKKEFDVSGKVVMFEDEELDE